MQLIVNEFLSLDGVMQGPGGAEEDPSGGFDRGGWIVPFAAQPKWGEVVSGWFSRAEAILLGRSTYDMMHPYWSQVDDPENSVGIALNSLPKYVVSSTLAGPSWRGTQVLSGDPLQEIRRLKEIPGGELQVHGSWRLARTLHEAGLVDEYRLLVFPVVVGTGKRLFDTGGPATGLTVRECSTLDEGTVSYVLTPTEYRRGGLAVVDGREVLLDPSPDSTAGHEGHRGEPVPG
ncbi:dihydrofolate reductase family protein [Microbacterium sp. ProA8]|jgi:dihydrofolate reductase|uniref:dihydrofolate reductase family protein n=1 Tax=Microbacterium chionoecetis TaxID=3153754 RepID=UPI003266A28B